MEERNKKKEEQWKFTRHFGAKIQAIRKRVGFSQEKLSELADINRSYMGRIERGESNPPVYTVYKIIRALKVNPIELF